MSKHQWPMNMRETIKALQPYEVVGGGVDQVNLLRAIPTLEDFFALPVHPAASRFPMMGEADLQALADDMKARGRMDHPIAILLGKDGPQLLDGRNRREACKRAGIKPTLRVAHTGDPDAFVDSANLHRRHLTPAQQQQMRKGRVERVAEARRAGKSTRQIAGEEGVSQVQVRRDLRMAKATEPGGSVEPRTGKVKGKDGKERTATPRRKPTLKETLIEDGVEEKEAEADPQRFGPVRDRMDQSGRVNPAYEQARRPPALQGPAPPAGADEDVPPATQKPCSPRERAWGAYLSLGPADRRWFRAQLARLGEMD